MNLKDDVCSLEYSIKLSKMGFSTVTPFQWAETPATYSIDSNLVKTITSTEFKLVFGKYTTLEGGVINVWPAYTAGQLFDLLPAFIDTKKDEPFNNFYLHLVKREFPETRYILNYYCDTCQMKEYVDPFFATQLIQCTICDEKLSDALAKLLIVLLEQGFIENET